MAAWCSKVMPMIRTAIHGIVVSAPRMPGAHTVYTAVGNLFAYLCVAATLILAGVAARTKAAAYS
jgi:hypothetical protein